MDVGLLFSGGKDSSLAALLLEPFYEVTLVTVHFGVSTDWKHAEESARAVGLPFEVLELDRAIAESAAAQIADDGYPRHGIQSIHLAALEAAAERGFSTIADGTRRDDRAPTVSRPEAQRLEDTFGVDYLAPLAGFGRGAIDRLVDRVLEVESGASECLDCADYEAELRTVVAETESVKAVSELFPPHEQTCVRRLQ